MAQFKSDKTNSNISNKENIIPDLSPGAGSFEEIFQSISSFGSGSLAGKKVPSLSVRLHVSNLPFRYRSVFSISNLLS